MTPGQARRFVARMKQQDREILKKNKDLKESGMSEEMLNTFFDYDEEPDSFKDACVEETANPDSHIGSFKFRQVGSTLCSINPDDVAIMRELGITLTDFAASGLLSIDSELKQYEPLGNIQCLASVDSCKQKRIVLTQEGIQENPDLVDQALDKDKICVELDKLLKLAYQRHGRPDEAGGHSRRF